MKCSRTLVFVLRFSFPQVGVLPVPHAIVVRKYQANKYTGLVYNLSLGCYHMRNQEMPLWDGSHIKIFSVHDSSKKK